MRYFLTSLRAVFMKDIVTELRARQVLPTMVVLGMLIVWVLRIACETAAGSTAIIGPVAFWIAFLFAGLLAQERSFATEEQNDCMDGLLLAPIDAGTIYLAKLLVNIVMLCIFEIIIVPVVIIAFGLRIGGHWPSLIGVLLLGNIAISSVGTLFSAIVQLCRTRGSLLSILVLVVLAPVMVPATFALLLKFGAIPAELAGTGALAFVGTFKTAVGYMVVFDAVFVTASWLLFGFAIKE
ncbi:MAG: heme exporter protein CcmB [Phycisphaerae bacterium]|nr:heme exporter protein CcmB [Phycisphaerae bacterium]